MQASILAAFAQDYTRSWLGMYALFEFYRGRRILRFGSLPLGFTPRKITGILEKQRLVANKKYS
jgi:hypothetical protein